MKLVVALDLEYRDDNLALVKELKHFDDIWLKVGLRSFIRDGKSFIEDIKNINSNFKIFLDLKLYDIPNTMADASSEIAKIGVDMFNIHCSSGEEAIKSVVDRVKSINPNMIILGVTALTSFDEVSFKAVYNSNLKEKAFEFAKMGYKNGLDGVVCSVYESKEIKNITNSSYITLTPAIRPFESSNDDQKRVATIENAKEALSNYIVVGRPIYKSENRVEMVDNIIKAML